jgi:hypothetical protein
LSPAIRISEAPVEFEGASVRMHVKARHLVSKG